MFCETADARFQAWSPTTQVRHIRRRREQSLTAIRRCFRVPLNDVWFSWAINARLETLSPPRTSWNNLSTANQEISPPRIVFDSSPSFTKSLDRVSRRFCVLESASRTKSVKSSAVPHSSLNLIYGQMSFWLLPCFSYPYLRSLKKKNLLLVF